MNFIGGLGMTRDALLAGFDLQQLVTERAAGAVYIHARMVGMAANAVLPGKLLVKGHGLLFRVLFNDGLALCGAQADVGNLVARDALVGLCPDKGGVTGKTIRFDLSMAFD